MEYIGVRELEQFKTELTKTTKKVLDNGFTKIKKELKTKYRSTIQQVYDMILANFKFVARESFNRVFLNRYGKNYDPTILNNSLRCSLDQNLSPHLSYDIHDFTLKTDFDKEKVSFNQNYSKRTVSSEFLSLDELDALEEMEFYGLSVDDESPLDWAESESNCPEDVRVFKPKKLIRPPKEVYMEAEGEAMKDFLVSYNSVIKPHIKSKFGINL